MCFLSYVIFFLCKISERIFWIARLYGLFKVKTPDNKFCMHLVKVHIMYRIFISRFRMFLLFMFHADLIFSCRFSLFLSSWLKTTLHSWRSIQQPFLEIHLNTSTFIYTVGSFEAGLKGLIENISTQVFIVFTHFNFYRFSCDLYFCF